MEDETQFFIGSGGIKLKIGILTWFFGTNYGAKLHSFALMKTIQNMGHECFIIDYRPENYLKTNFWMSLNFQKRSRHPILVLKALNRWKKFNSFNEKYNLTKRVYTANEIDSLGLDVIVLGSDEIFNLDHVLSQSIYYGVGIKNTKLITYAPCSGFLDIQIELPEEIKTSLNKMYCISSRDEHTKKLIENNVNRNVEVVADPTLLYDFRPISNPFKENNYILLFSFSPWDEYQNEIKKYAKQKGKRVISVGRFCSWADHSYVDISVGDWLGAFEGADFVITDSFHGLCFAIKNHKEFLVLGRSDKTNKINDLLMMLHIERPIYDGGEDLYQMLLTNEEIDYSLVEHTIKEMKVKSINYLKKGIEE